jgi:hypothetical protein
MPAVVYVSSEGGERELQLRESASRENQEIFEKFAKNSA